MDDSRIKDVSSLLRAFFDEEQIRRGGQYSSFLATWKTLVGERAAGHSRIADIERGNLVIEADHPGWIQILQLRQSEILKSARDRFPELSLRGIVFRLSSRNENPSTETVPRPGPFGPDGNTAPVEIFPNPSPDRDRDRRKGTKGPLSLEGIEDPLLKERLEALKKAMEDEGSAH